jgi:uncharacterized protein YdaU (DUF1376 family)
MRNLESNMETLAPVPANADLAPVTTTDADAAVVHTEGDGSAPSAPEAGTPAPKRDAVQERIDKLTREKYDNARLADQRGYELERERAENQRIAAELAALRKSETTQVAPDGFPTLEQFGFDEGRYQAAVTAHIASLAEKHGEAAAEKRLNAERERQQAERANQTWAQKEAELIKSKPDYVEKVLNAQTLPISEGIQKVLKGHELGPHIALHMVDNAEASRAIMRLPMDLQLIEVGRIAAKLEAAKLPPKPAVSQAPPPVQKVDADEAVVEKSPAEMTDAQFAKWRRSQIAQRRNN